MTSPSLSTRIFVFVINLCLAGSMSGAPRSRAKSKVIQSKSKTTQAGKAVVTAKVKSSGTKSRLIAKQSTRKMVAGSRLRSKRRPGNTNYVAGGPWLEPTLADSTVGDNVDG